MVGAPTPARFRVRNQEWATKFQNSPFFSSRTQQAPFWTRIWVSVAKLRARSHVIVEATSLAWSRMRNLEWSSQYQTSTFFAFITQQVYFWTRFRVSRGKQGDSSHDIFGTTSLTWARSRNQESASEFQNLVLFSSETQQARFWTRVWVSRVKLRVRSHNIIETTHLGRFCMRSLISAMGFQIQPLSPPKPKKRYFLTRTGVLQGEEHEMQASSRPPLPLGLVRGI